MPEPPLPLPDDPPATLLERLTDLEAYVVRNDERISALEADVSRVEETQPGEAELGRLRWFMKHGRRRPW